MSLVLVLLPSLPPHSNHACSCIFFTFNFPPSLSVDVMAVEKAVIVEGDTEECLSLGGLDMKEEETCSLN